MSQQGDLDQKYILRSGVGLDLLITCEVCAKAQKLWTHLGPLPPKVFFFVAADILYGPKRPRTACARDEEEVV